MSSPTLTHDDTGETLDLGLPGGALASAGDGESTYRTSIGDLDRDEQAFRPAAIDGQFRDYFGVSGRSIIQRGELRLSATGLASVRAQREIFRRLAGIFTFCDDDGAEYANCVIDGFEIPDKSTCAVAGASELIWYAPYELRLTQIVP